MSPTTAHSLGSAPRCRPPPPPCIRAGTPRAAHRRTPLPLDSQATSEGKSSSDDAPSSQDVGPSQHHDNAKSEEIVEEEEVVAEEEDVAAEAASRKHLEDMAAEPPTFSQGAENSAAAVQGVALAPQVSSADAPAPDEQDECATTDDECATQIESQTW